GALPRDVLDTSDLDPVIHLQISPWRAYPSSALRAPSPARGEGDGAETVQSEPLLPLREKVDRPQAETDEGLGSRPVRTITPPPPARRTRPARRIRGRPCR